MDINELNKFEDEEAYEEYAGTRLLLNAILELSRKCETIEELRESLARILSDE